MTHFKKLTGRNATSTSQIITMVFAGFLLFALHASAVQAQWTTNGNNINNTNTGNVGIGTTSPATQFHVVNSSTAQARIESTGAAAAAIDFKNSSRRWVLGTGLLAGGGDFSIFDANAFLTRMYFDTSGNVGIGTTNPTRKLEVLATDGEAMRLYRNSSNVGWGVNLKFAFNNSSGTEVDYAGLHGVTASTTAGAEAGSMVFTTVTNGSLTEKMRLTSAGSLGLGTATPGYRLDVQGGQINSSGGLCIAGDCKTAWSQVGGGSGSQWTTTGSNIYYNIGSVGIGASGGPVGKLDVRQISNGGGYATLLTSYGANEDTYLRGGSSNAVLHIGDLSATTAKVLLAESGGNVGIGTTSPTKKLDVAGDINASGTITGGNIVAKYQDVAEWVVSSQELAAGTVVVLDQTKSNQVIASSQAYDTRVAGVISLQPGIALGESGAGKVLVATTGRVRVKVDATAGPIQVGDLLVTSDQEGIAKKSEPLSLGGVQIHRPGTLIGKALEPLSSGTGEILVLLSLQ